MKIIPFLRLDRSCMYDSSLIRDLQLDKMLSPQALRILRTPCEQPSAETIKARQAFYICMDDPEFTRLLDGFSAALFRLSKQIELYQESRVEFERLCLRLQALAAYVNVCDALSMLDGTTPLLSEAWHGLNDDLHRAMLNQLRADLGKANMLLQRMEYSVFLLTDSVTYADTAWLLKDSGEYTFGEQFVALAKRMGIELVPAEPRPLKLDPMIDEAYTKLYREEVEALRAILAQYAWLDLSAPTTWLEELRFIQEIHALSQKARKLGIATCFPAVSVNKCYRATDAYDITLTAKDCTKIIPNDIDFSPDAPFCFLTGANGGGKTTYLRAVGVNLLLFMAGCPIFAKSAEIFPFSGVFTHFPEDEVFSGMGRLDSEKLRVDRILESADSDAFILLNETFSATDEEKGFSLAIDTAQTLRARGIYGLYVTHFLEVKTKGFPVLTAMVEEDGEHRRTFKIYRADGADSSYARDILRKYKLDPVSLAERRRGL